MSSPSIQFHKIWIEQCNATEGMQESFGPKNALDYLIGEKLFHFVQASEQHPEFDAELPAFVAEIRRIFGEAEIGEYLRSLERTKFLTLPSTELETDNLDDESDEELWPDNPVRGAEELLRFCRIRQLLHP